MGFKKLAFVAALTCMASVSTADVLRLMPSLIYAGPGDYSNTAVIGNQSNGDAVIGFRNNGDTLLLGINNTGRSFTGIGIGNGGGGGLYTIGIGTENGYRPRGNMIAIGGNQDATLVGIGNNGEAGALGVGNSGDSGYVGLFNGGGAVLRPLIRFAWVTPSRSVPQVLVPR